MSGFGESGRTVHGDGKEIAFAFSFHNRVRYDVPDGLAVKARVTLREKRDYAFLKSAIQIN